MAKEKKYYIKNTTTEQVLNVAVLSDPLPAGWEAITKAEAEKLMANQTQEG